MLVFVTGASGYLGLHIVNQLLEAGHTVRGAARGRKYQLLKAAFASTPSFEAIEVEDIGVGDLSKSLAGVDGIIHTAAPLPGRVGIEEGKRYAAEGAVHVLREGLKAGVTRAVVTSSIATFPNGGFSGPYGHRDFIEVTEDSVGSEAGGLYVLGKTLADKTIIKFAEEHPEMSIMILGPSWLLGPLAPQFPTIIPSKDLSALATAHYIWQLLQKDNTTYAYAPGFIDVRDAARIHITALGVSSTHGSSQKPSSWKEALHIIARERPELQERLANSDDPSVPNWDAEDNKVRLSKEEIEEQTEILGINADSFIPWEKTILDGVDNILEIENKWKQDA
ncbi:NAD(P)-binding protein [Cylindrobasidium torrendii FP15055 ss-10]|uniref:NAD(P)-binding protein n=1 Tax=Cylindrobasidium torrendii FP15055 ss-10 TaxID=1314674 RepID=A0A0D7B7T8_9AGAR|nr:NAD(P)-binding protein [Cylindrobasidium torrendii FP15055 ss-10]